MRLKYIVFFQVLTCIHALKILGIFPHPGKSHFDVFEPLFLKLNSLGHTITVISHFPREKQLENYEDVSLKGTTKELRHFIDLENLMTHTRELKILGALPLADFAKKICSLLGSNVIQDFIKEDHHFDVVLIEMWTTDCFLGLIPKLKAPFIGLCSNVIMPWTNDRFGNIEHPAYVPVMFMDYSDRLSFLERVENSLVFVFNKVLHVFWFERPGNDFVRKYIGEKVPVLSDIAKNVSLMLVNTHFTLNLPRPLVPAVVEVGGMHIKDGKPLSKNIEKWINESDAGVIYLSMGSMIKGHSFPEETRDAFIRAFARLPQRVLWKWENDTLPGKTDNIMIQKWMPQFDILCHPNVKAYISHGGLLGTTEAVHCGVPAVVTPQYGDQFVNAAALQAGGGGVVLDFKTATEDTIYEALNNILQPNFQQQAKKLSERFRDRPMPPLETAIYWVEYVARHGGAHHMRTAAVGMPWYQYLLLDVVAFLAAVVITLLLITYFVLRTLWKLVMKTTTKAKKE